MDTPDHIIVAEYSYGLEPREIELCTGEEAAREALKVSRTYAEESGIPVAYRLFRLVEVQA
ncbi:hypothetical protein GCM10010172_80310 [Paractinoplanes ferrugineus]|uniref:Uncharacterized protein n=1 Tax=Paractinoplanes ferrugineus TaxID=113564 RepID=A0A919J9Q8_9ACTN|nr:hypothetical protein [Actinoplanes ferrugineus]GIE16748.1 hypothetical protein Afe05nite_85880 [Actinoplanes ferrugineus]